MNSSSSLCELLANASAPIPLCDSIAHMTPSDFQALLQPATQTDILNSYVQAFPFGSDHVTHYETLIRVMLPRIFAEGGHLETVTRPPLHLQSLEDQDAEKQNKGDKGDKSGKGSRGDRGDKDKGDRGKEGKEQDERDENKEEPIARTGVKHTVTFKNVRVQVPMVGSTDAQPRGLKATLGGGTEKLMPEEALVRGMTYALTITADVEHRAFDLTEVSPLEFPVLPLDIPLSFVRLPSVWAELRRRTALWDVDADVPEVLEDALERDTIAHAATFPSAPQKSASQLLVAAIEGESIELGRLREHLMDWACRRAQKEHAPRPTFRSSNKHADNDTDMNTTASSANPVPTLPPNATATATTPTGPLRFQESLRSPATVCFDLPIFLFPCMLGTCFDNETVLPPSKRYMREAPGTFICRGTLKGVRSQKVQRSNVWVLSGTHLGEVTASVRSVHPEKFRSSSTLYAYLAPGACGACTLTLDVPYLPNLPVVTIFRFLGFHTAADIEALVFPSFYRPEERWRYESEAIAEERRRFATNFSSVAMTKPLEELYEAAGRNMKKPEETVDKRRRQVHTQITTELLPQVGFDDSFKTRMKKGLFLGLLVRELLKVCFCVSVFLCFFFHVSHKGVVSVVSVV